MNITGRNSFTPESKVVFHCTNFNGILQRDAIPKFTPISQEMCKVGIEIHSHLYVKNDCRCALFIKLMLAGQLLVNNSYTEFNEN